ncbi:MAG: FMN-dependent oxidoreductase, nitrilotriacetate monooxygenase family, partial [Microbacteriaceae bacterium]|nr:FMN-dependent oxidoreductase, nitrilotriacetate monooxygenase family [Microbacteriaceae bacterium]
MFHLGWFTNPRPHGWAPAIGGGTPFSGNDLRQSVWQTGEFLIDMARSLDRAGFDYIMLEDHIA